MNVQAIGAFLLLTGVTTLRALGQQPAGDVAAQTRRTSWDLQSGGPGCGLYRSTDGGDTWTEVSTARGFASGMLGKMGLAKKCRGA